MKRIGDVVLVVVAIAYVAFLQMLARCSLAVLVIVAAACSTRPPAAMPSAAAADIRAASVHCFVVVARPASVDEDIDSTVCFSAAWACDWLRSIVEDHAGAIGVLSLTEECEERVP